MCRKLKEPRVLTDFNNDAVCILPNGFELTDERWEQIRDLHEKLNRINGHVELLQLFPEELALQEKKIRISDIVPMPHQSSWQSAAAQCPSG